MAVAFESTDQHVSGSSLAMAMALARLRTATGRPTAVLVADSVANLSAVSRGDDEVLIDTSASASERSTAVLAAAEVIVVLVDPHTLDERGPNQLGRLQRAAAANPRNLDIPYHDGAIRRRSHRLRAAVQRSFAVARFRTLGHCEWTGTSRR